MNNTGVKGALKRASAWLLALVLTAGLLPAGLTLPAYAAEESWAKPYLDQLVSWGVMRGDLDGNLAPDRAITRAEYATMINRAYGYDELGSTPFIDVKPSDWFAEDIAIAYTAGYFAGTSANTASPNGRLTREEATLILGRNMMLQESVGESVDFTDSRTLGEWSRGIVKAAAEGGVVSGYPDGTFRPRSSISRGEVAALLVSAVGTPIQKPGEYNLGSVYGNVTISSSGVTLRNTTITGDLYLTGGVGLGYVTLENVTVLGKIIASGAGESNKGDNSLILRNVEAEELVVDSLANQFVTLRAEGDTEIKTTSVRTSAYLEDVTSRELGLKYIELNGENGIGLELAGNIGEVLNLTPGSSLIMAQGSAAQITVDEKALGSRLTVENGAEVKTLNLDVGTSVTGRGDVDHLNVNSNGSTVAMLPDIITVRPGVSATVDGEKMDTVTAAEASADPRILSGYPKARDISPTSAVAAFSANKKGTVYWAVSAISDGSVGEADLINPPTYASKVLSSGKAQVNASGTEVTGKISKLTSDGSYYLSAVLVDGRGEHSPVKVTSFSTPDDTTPNFASGYPTMTRITKDSAQVMVMTTKSCQLYYALLPKGSAAPKGADFKAGAVTGNKGYGSLDVKKNTTHLITVNREALKELESYDLYLWLTDFDGAKSSAVKKVTFTTVDGTPPIFQINPLNITSLKEKSVGLTGALDEAGTVYWAVVKEGETYPKPQAGAKDPPLLTSQTAKIQVASGINAVKSGKSNASANKEFTLNITGLEAETAYDLYYVAQDKAGNYSATVEKMSIHTLDNTAPSVKQEFTHFNSGNANMPLADTDIRLVFSENIRDRASNAVLLTLYEMAEDATQGDADRNAARNQLTGILNAGIQLWTVDSTGIASRVPTGGDNWVIDYAKAQVAMEDGKLVVTFSNEKGALNLRSGATYYFVVDGLMDTSDAGNIMPKTQLENFKTVSAQVNLATTNTEKTDTNVGLDMAFKMLPVSTSKVESGNKWDMLIWSDVSCKFEVYRREYDADKARPDEEWLRLGEAEITISTGQESPQAVSLVSGFLGGEYPDQNQLDETKAYEYGIHFTSIEGIADAERASWSQLVTVKISVAAGSASNLGLLYSPKITPSAWKTATESGGLDSIGVREDFTMKKQFKDEVSPKFIQGHPKFSAGDTLADVTVMLDRPGTVYYVVAKEGVVPPLRASDNELVRWGNIPKQGTLDDGGPEKGEDEDGNIVTLPTHVPLSSPSQLNVLDPKYGSVGVQSGYLRMQGGAETIRISGLESKTRYHVYFVLSGATRDSEVKYYGFETGDVKKPAITLRNQSPQAQVTTSQDAVLDYVLFSDQQIPTVFTKKLSDYGVTGTNSGDTILKALTSTDSATGYSVFDKFATDPLKEEVAEIIRTTSAATGFAPVDWGQLQTVADKHYLQSFQNMTDTATYVMIAVAHHVQGTEDAFKAVTSIRQMDTDPPDFKSVSTTSSVINPDPTVDWTQNPTNYAYKGTVTVSFDEDIYIYKGDVDETTGLRKALEVWCCWSSQADEAKAVSVMDVIGGSLATGGKLTPSGVKRASSSMTLSFDDVRHGDTIILFDTGTISDEGGADIRQKLTLTFDATYKGNTAGVLSPSFVATWG